MRHRRCITRSLAALAVAAGVVLGPAPADAAPVVNEIDEGSFSFDPDCEGIDLVGEGTFWEHVLIHSRGRDGHLHLQANVQVTEVVTNLANGKTFTSDFRFTDQDHSITDNGDGTFTVIIKLTGRIQHRGPDGRLVFIDAGQIVNETLWADDGFFPSGGTFLGSETLKNVGLSQTADRDFCADMHEFLG